MRQQRCVRGHDDDDGAALGEVGGHPGVGVFALDFASHRNAGDTQVLPRAVVALDEDADQVAAFLPLRELVVPSADV
jgi:hypothetical protein